MFQPPNNLEGQVFDGLFETDDCWDFSGVGCMEIILSNLWSQFSPVAKQFFTSNNYCDASGNFALSRRYIAVLSGVKNYGNYQLDFWTLVKQYGIIPRSILDFTATSSQDPNYQAFVSDFFNPASITQAMKDLGAQFLTYVSVNATSEDPKLYEQFVAKTPVQLGIPIPKNSTMWNASTVAYDGSTQIQHAVVGLGGTLNAIPILDSYIPWVKTLTGNYLIGILTVPSITVNTSEYVSYSFVIQVINLLKSWGAWTIKGIF